MKLLTFGAITPFGSNIAEHCLNKSKQVAPRVEYLEYFIHGAKRKIAVHRALSPTIKLPVPDGVLRRMGLSTQLALSCIEEACSSLQVDLKNKKIALLVGTTQGPSSTNIEYFKRLVSFNYRGASPNLFAQSVYNNIASSVALAHSWNGPTCTLVQEEGLWPSLMKIAKLWLQEASADYVWVIVGNEMSLHVPYFQLYDRVKEDSDLEVFTPRISDMPDEAYSCFLLGPNTSSNGADFDLKNTSGILSRAEHVGCSLSPERIGVSLAEFFYKEKSLNV
ncbi:MAG: hypothetical protein R3A80_00740 [Bdellovibrionota bacterium]